MTPRFDFEVREDFIGDAGKEQWVIEHSDAGRREHGPFRSLAEARKLIAVRKLELEQSK